MAASKVGRWMTTLMEKMEMRPALEQLSYSVAIRFGHRNHRSIEHS